VRTDLVGRTSLGRESACVAAIAVAVRTTARAKTGAYDAAVAPAAGIFPLRIWAADLSPLLRLPFTLGGSRPYGIAGVTVPYRPPVRALCPKRRSHSGTARASAAAVAGGRQPQKACRCRLPLTDHITRRGSRTGAAMAYRDQRNRTSPTERDALVRLTSNVRLLLAHYPLGCADRQQARARCAGAARTASWT
jgi:hypothetical protein